MSNSPAKFDASKLHPNFRPKVEKFLAEAGDKIRVTEGVRSQARQNHLYSLGRTRPGSIVTWTLTSNHITGRAIDICFVGLRPYPPRKDWLPIVAIAKKYGINWGGEWRNPDSPHFEDNFQPMPTPTPPIPPAWAQETLQIMKSAKIETTPDTRVGDLPLYHLLSVILKFFRAISAK
jgi:hypothetical protein